MRLPRIHHDRGEIGIVAAILSLLAGAAIAATTIYATRPAGNAPGVYIRVDTATAIRTDDDRPLFRIGYYVAVEPDRSGPAPWTAESKVACFAIEQAGRKRVFIAETSIFVFPGGNRAGTLTIVAPPSASDAGGAFAVTCELTREGRFFRSGLVDVTVPESKSSGGGTRGGGGGFDVGPYLGNFRVTFTRTEGIDLNNCTPASQGRNIEVSKNSTGIVVRLLSAATGGTVTGFDAEVGPTGQFSGELYFDAADNASKGLVTARFEERAGKRWVSGTFVRDDHHCTFTFEGPKEELADTGTVTVALQDIPGVDGCEPVVSPARAKAGVVTFKVVNATSGFAQMFVYDDHNNYVTNNDKDVPPKGGSVTFQATIRAGTYSITCDGPGAEDKSAPFTVA